MAASLTGAATPASHVYAVRNYLLKNGSQAARWHRFMGQTALPALATVHARPALILEALIAPHIPQTMAIFEFASLEEWRAVDVRLAASDAYRAGFAEWESGAEAPYESYTERLLTAAPFNPGLTPSPVDAAARVFEWRIYHSPTWRQLEALNQRFAGPEIPIFHRVGIQPVLYANALTGDALPNLTYLTPFASLAAREQAWAAFLADPEWIQVRADSIQAHGQISSVMHISLWKPAAYSPVR